MKNTKSISETLDDVKLELEETFSKAKGKNVEEAKRDISKAIDVATKRSSIIIDESRKVSEAILQISQKFENELSQVLYKAESSSDGSTKSPRKVSVKPAEVSVEDIVNQFLGSNISAENKSKQCNHDKTDRSENHSFVVEMDACKNLKPELCNAVVNTKEIITKEMPLKPTFMFTGMENIFSGIKRKYLECKNVVSLFNQKPLDSEANEEPNSDKMSAIDFAFVLLF
ncbi:hypothetical protein FQA39_LY03296 [Lamprigera yunnana]|nr:hypothetical protein FQA39_LY03296 [Lamprigera yunnana]